MANQDHTYIKKKGDYGPPKRIRPKPNPKRLLKKYTSVMRRCPTHTKSSPVLFKRKCKTCGWEFGQM